METLKRILKFLYIYQEVSNKGRNPYIGQGYSTAYRLNPYNPFSYILLLIVILIGFLLFGIIGFWNEIDRRNPFEWN